MRLFPTARAAALALGLAGALALAAPAGAHVSVPDPAPQGGVGQITFRVAAESDTASTVRLEVNFPADQPLAVVTVDPQPGWTHRVERARLATPAEVEGRTIDEAVRRITWTATGLGAGIKPGDHADFSVDAGVLPKTDTMVFKAIQTYSDGRVVRWIEEAAPGAEEPERPAPVLRLVPAAGGGAEPSAAPAVTPAVGPAEDAPSRGTVDVALGWAAAALLAGLAALVAAARALRRRTPATGPADRRLSRTP